MTTDRDTPNTNATTTGYSRPVGPLTKALARITAPQPGVSFRSTLLRSQQRLSPAKSRPLASKSINLGGLSFQNLTGINLFSQTDANHASTTKHQANGAPSVSAVASAVSAVAAPQTGAPGSTPPGVVGSAAQVPVSNFRETVMPLAAFPRPEGDNGRGMHWVPTLSSSNAVVDRFVREAKEMRVKWMVILNDGTKTGSNDYLVKQLAVNGIMPIMRIYTPNGRPIEGDLGACVRHYRQLGVQYFQLYNEPNLKTENPNGIPSVDQYLDKWIPAAQVVLAAGGLPGIGALSPGGDFDDIEFLKQMFDKIKQRGELATLDRAWLSLHNYTMNHPLDYAKDSNGFMKFKWYDAIVREKLGRQMPIIGTEGGTYVGSAEDKMFSRVDEAKQMEMVTGAYQYMRNREPYNFAYTYWIIANEEGGGFDPAFSHQALFKRNGPSPLVGALKNLG